MMTKGYYTVLQDRSAIRVSGPEARDFLQNLITQDVAVADANGIAYGALLTPQGKMEYDFFIYAQGDSYFLECESVRAQELSRRLTLFRLRKKVVIETSAVKVVAAWGAPLPHVTPQLLADPRPLPGMFRNIVNEAFDFAQLNGFEEATFNIYHGLCIGAKVPLGSLDIAWGEDSAADINLEYLNGVSYTKGCYVGQELTSRMHHRNLGKRALYTVKLTGETLAPFTDIVAPDGPLAGEMRSHEGRMGLALLRHDSLPQAARAGFVAVTGAEEAA